MKILTNETKTKDFWKNVAIPDLGAGPSCTLFPRQ